MNNTAITNKIKHINDQINSIKNEDRIVFRIGDLQPKSLDAEVKFQEERLKELMFISDSPIDKVMEREAELEKELGRNLKLVGKSLLGVDEELVLRISKLELVKLALNGEG